MVVSVRRVLVGTAEGYCEICQGRVWFLDIQGGLGSICGNAYVKW